ncbi:MAG: O-antigen ligase family protein [Pseudomonadota bacterium]
MQQQSIQPQETTIAFFFLFLYTVCVLIRPHEIWVEYSDWIIIRVFAILCFLSILLTKRPIIVPYQTILFIIMLPLIMVSAFLNGEGSKGIGASQEIFIALILPLFMYANAITTIKRQHLLMFVSIAASLIMIHNGYIQFESDSGYGWAGYSHIVTGSDRGGTGRITYLGFFNDPNDLGMLIVMNIPFVVYFYVKGNFFKKLLMIIIILIFAYGIELTGSRGTQLGAFSLIVVYFLVNSAGYRLFLFIVLLSPIVATVIASFSGIASQDASADGRLEAWYYGINMMLANPVFGVGMDNFIGIHGRTAHNSYVLVAAELGVPGYSLWGGALIFTVLVSYLMIKSQKPVFDKKTRTYIPPKKVNEESKNELLLNKTLFFSLIGFMITGFFLSRTYTVVLFIYMGMTIASHLRLINLIPEYSILMNKKMLFKSMLYSWVVIIAVYLSLKVGL